MIYEGRGPQGSAVLIECLTDNKNRAASEVRLAMTRNGGTMADPGSVSYHVHPQGRGVPAEERPDRGRRADGGPRRWRRRGQGTGDIFEVHCEPTDLRAVVAALEDAGIEYETDEVEFVSSMQVDLEADAALPSS